MASAKFKPKCYSSHCHCDVPDNVKIPDAFNPDKIKSETENIQNQLQKDFKSYFKKSAGISEKSEIGQYSLVSTLNDHLSQFKTQSGIDSGINQKVLPENSKASFGSVNISEPEDEQYVDDYRPSYTIYHNYILRSNNFLS
jgi:hypothetical protein